MTRETVLSVSHSTELAEVPLGLSNKKCHIHFELLTIFHLFLTIEFPTSTLF